jgi:hypothetical protein
VDAIAAIATVISFLWINQRTNPLALAAGTTAKTQSAGAPFAATARITLQFFRWK